MVYPEPGEEEGETPLFACLGLAWLMPCVPVLGRAGGGHRLGPGCV